MQLISIPFLGGNRYSLNHIRRQLPPGTGYIPVELPGRGTRIDVPLLYDTEEMVADIYGQLLPFIEEPYVLYGDCMGGLLAFLVTRTLRDNGERLPVHLVISD